MSSEQLARLALRFANALEPRYQVVRVSRTGTMKADLNNPSSIDALFESVGTFDVVVCCAASVQLTPLLSLSRAAVAELVKGSY